MWSIFTNRSEKETKIAAIVYSVILAANCISIAFGNPGLPDQQVIIQGNSKDNSTLCPDKILDNYGLRKFYFDGKICRKCPKCTKRGHGLSEPCGNGLGINATCVKCKEGETYSERGDKYGDCQPCRECDNREEDQPCTIYHDRKCGKCKKCHFSDPIFPDHCHVCDRVQLPESATSPECQGCFPPASELIEASSRSNIDPSQTPSKIGAIHSPTGKMVMTPASKLSTSKEFTKETYGDPQLAEEVVSVRTEVESSKQPNLNLLWILVILVIFPIGFIVYKVKAQPEKVKSDIEMSEQHGNIAKQEAENHQETARKFNVDNKQNDASKRKCNRNSISLSQMKITKNPREERESLTMSDQLNKTEETNFDGNSEASETDQFLKDDFDNQGQDVFCDNIENTHDREKIVQDIGLTDEEKENCSATLKGMLNNVNLMQKLRTLMDRRKEVKCLTKSVWLICELEYIEIDYIVRTAESQTNNFLQTIVQSKPNTKIVELLACLAKSDRNDVVKEVVNWHSECAVCKERFKDI